METDRKHYSGCFCSRQPESTNPRGIGFRGAIGVPTLMVDFSRKNTLYKSIAYSYFSSGGGLKRSEQGVVDE